MNTYIPGPTLLAAQRRVNAIRRQDITLKQEINCLVKTGITYEQARRRVLRAKGLLIQGGTWKQHS